MSRRTYERRVEAEENWPNLHQFLGCYFHEDRGLIHGTTEAALACAISKWRVDGRQLVLREWRNFMDRAGHKSDIRAWLNDGFGVNIHFRKESDAREFMAKVHDRLIESVRAEVGAKWAP